MVKPNADVAVANVTKPAEESFPMSLVKLKKDVKFVPARDRVLIFSSDRHVCIQGRENFTLVGRLAPLISSVAAPQDEVIQTFLDHERDAAAGILENLREGGMLCEAESLEEDATRKTPSIISPNITFIGHATLLIRTNGLHILTDPWLFTHNKYIDRWPYPFTFEDLPVLDLICISHEHSDHLNLPTLMRLDKRIPVLVPKIECPNKYNRNLELTLTRLGFETVICLETWECFNFQTTKITRTPCHKAWTVTEQATWLLETEEMSVFCGCDMLEDEPLMSQLGEQYDIDIAFLPISGFTARLASLPVKEILPAETHDQIMRDAMGVKEAVQATRWLKPKFAVGYANGGAYWYRHPEGSLSGEPAEEFVELLQRENPSVVGLDLKPGDIWEHKTERVIRYEQDA